MSDVAKMMRGMSARAKTEKPKKCRKSKPKSIRTDEVLAKWQEAKRLGEFPSDSKDLIELADALEQQKARGDNLVKLLDDVVKRRKVDNATRKVEMGVASKAMCVVVGMVRRYLKARDVMVEMSDKGQDDSGERDTPSYREWLAADCEYLDSLADLRVLLGKHR